MRPLSGNADDVSLALQTMLQDRIAPVPTEIDVVPLHLDGGFILDVQIPRHRGGPFMNKFTGGYLVRAGARNLPIDPGTLRSTFIDEIGWMTRLDELTAAEDARIVQTERMALERVLRIGILPREHFDYTRAPFTQSGHVRAIAPNFHESVRELFKSCEDGHEAFAIDMRQRGFERLFIRDDWFVHAHVAFAVGITQGEGRLTLGEFDRDFEHYIGGLATFFADQKIEGPFAVTMALQALNESEPMRIFFPRGSFVRTLRPKLVDGLDDPELIEDFKRRVRQASAYGG